jgi:hypothetical protein
MQVVRHEAIAKQQLLIAILGPKQRVDHGVGEVPLAERFALMPRADGEIVFVFAGGVGDRPEAAFRDVGDATNCRRDSSAATRYTPVIPVNWPLLAIPFASVGLLREYHHAVEPKYAAEPCQASAETRDGIL